MNIAIIGAGAVGAALANAWSRKQHSVVLGVRKPSDPKTLELAKRLGVRAASVSEAAQGADIVVLATPWPATQAAIEGCGPLGGKTVIDCTNPLSADFSGLTVGHTTSAAEHVAGWAKGASVFKCFNQTGASNMDGAARFDAKPVMFVAGDDAARKPSVMQLATDAGFEAVDAGALASARLLEPLAMLWIRLAFSGMGRDFAFALARKKG